MELSGQPYRNGRSFLAELRNNRDEQNVINAYILYYVLLVRLLFNIYFAPRTPSVEWTY